MATNFSPSTIFSLSSTSSSPFPKSSSYHRSQPSILVTSSSTTVASPKSLSTAAAIAATFTAAAASIVLSISPPSSLASDIPYQVYYGTAASAANYGGYGGNSSKKDSAEYIYEVPDGWKERLVSKVEKGTNGTDSEFYNPKKKSEKEYLTFLSGIRQLAPMEVILNNLALSDVELQDLISGAEDVRSEERKKEDGQVYYVYEIEGSGSHSLISVTCAKNKLYAHFVNAPTTEWNRDKDILTHIHESFKTVNV